jgi:hypothetical protein
MTRKVDEMENMGPMGKRGQQQGIGLERALN